MSFQQFLGGGLDYDLCCYGSSRLAFRGPYRLPQAVDVAVVGGTETFGKFVVHPYSTLLEQMCGRPVVNLGVLSGGLDSFRNDPIVEEVAQKARVCILQIMGAQGLTNRFYKVHKRRNDRFIAPTQELRNLYPEVDFADFSFVRHLLGRLERVSAERFAIVVNELRREWCWAMQEMVDRIAKPTILLWMADKFPDPYSGSILEAQINEPLLVTREMIDRIISRTDGYVEVVRPIGRVEDLKGMVFDDFERPAAARLPGAIFHGAVAAKLTQVIAPLLEVLAQPAATKRAPGRPFQR